VFCQVKFL